MCDDRVVHGPGDRIQRSARALRSVRWPAFVLLGAVYIFMPGEGSGDIDVAHGLLLTFTIVFFSVIPGIETVWRRFAEGYNTAPT